MRSSRSSRRCVPLSRSVTRREALLILRGGAQNIAALLHFAGCTLASLHPDPLSSFTSRELAVDDDEVEDGAKAGGAASGEGGEKLADFSKYAEGYYATLNVRFCEFLLSRES